MLFSPFASLPHGRWSNTPTELPVLTIHRRGLAFATCLATCLTAAALTTPPAGADQGEAALRMLIPAIADPEVRQHIEEFQRQARNAFHEDNPEATSEAVRKAREEHEAANARIGLLLRDL